MKFIDFFCGIGTIRMGMEQAGYECVYSVEWDKHKRRMYSVIFGKEPEGQDIRSVSANDLPRSDCWCFGAPCQDFSIAGKREGLEGDRSSLVREVFRLVRETKKEHRPKYLLYENVKGMLSSNKGFDFLEILIEMESLGYDTIEYSLLNSKNFGVPQNRERVFTIGHFGGRGERKIFPIRETSEGTLNQLNNPTHSTNRLYGINGIARCLRAEAGGKGAKTGLYLVNGTQEGNVYCLDANYFKGCNDLSKGRRSLVGTKTNRGRIRRLTPRECMRLQGVSDEVTDKLIAAGISDTQMYRGAGDACSVPVIYEIAKRMI